MLAIGCIGYGYVLKGICYAYLRGQNGPGIDESHLFYNNVIRTQNLKKWKESIALSRNKLSIEAKDKLASIHTTSYLIVKNNELILEKYCRKGLLKTTLPTPSLQPKALFLY